MLKTKILTAKEIAVVEYYCDPVSDTRNNWCKSYLLAGYANCKGYKTNALRVLAKDYIKTAIKTAREKVGEKIAVTREFCVNKLFDIANTSQDNREIISAITVIGDFAGYKRELAPNKEREQARHDLLSEEVKEIMKLVRSRTAALSLSPVTSPKTKRVTSEEITLKEQVDGG
jgi:hypothetical protein